jgi:ATP-dependent Zn protease
MNIEQTAIHEAGHVVVAHALGLACKDAALTHELVDETGAYGYAEGPNPRFGYHVENERERQAIMRDAAIACCAGLAAEHVFFGVPLDVENENAKGDFDNIIGLQRAGLRIKGSKVVGNEQAWKYIDKLLGKAVKLVRKRRQEIRRVADSLLENKRLNAVEIERLLAPSGEK